MRPLLLLTIALTAACSSPKESEPEDAGTTTGDIDMAMPEAGRDADTADAGDATDACVERVWFADVDGDGHGSAAVTQSSCTQPRGYVESSDDCNDGCMECRPGGEEVCGNDLDDDCANGSDDGCDCMPEQMRPCPGGVETGECEAGTQTCGGDGTWGACIGTVVPASETCNGRDDDCNGTPDDGAGRVFYRDADGDGFGAASATMRACAMPVGYVTDSTDCDDGCMTCRPGGTEVCGTGLDEDCTGGDLACTPAWPTGADGPLTVSAGATIEIPAGSVRDYSSVTIEAGGTLRIGPGAAWTFIGVASDLVINGELVAQGHGDSLSSPLDVVALAPDDTGAPLGERVSYTVTQSAGGAGGTCGGATTDRRPGNAAFGNGGGGCGFGYMGGGAWVNDQAGGAVSGRDATSTTGGDGGGGTCYVHAPGAAIHGMSGAMPSACSGDCGAGAAFGGGGGSGGSRGRHGQGIYIKVHGRLLGNGRIQASGEAGGDGGPANPYYVLCNPAYAFGGGGGGGGGAGGCGGAVVIRHHGTISPLLEANIDTRGGRGGMGGAGGPGNYGDGSPRDALGGAGQAGVAGLDGLPADIRAY